MEPTRYIGRVCDKHPEMGGERMLSNRSCVTCKNERTKAIRVADPEKYSAYRKVYEQANKEAKYTRNRHWRATNKDKVAQMNRAKYLADRENRIAYAKNAWAVRNRLIQSQGAAKFYVKELTQIYKDCPPGHHVDHIIPLRGKMVSGLHVPFNLQYLPAKVNLSKGNSFQGETV